MAQHLTQLGASEHSNNCAQSANLLKTIPARHEEGFYVARFS